MSTFQKRSRKCEGLSAFTGIAVHLAATALRAFRRRCR